MKKLVFVSLLGTLVAPTGALAQDAAPAPLPPEVESEGHVVEEPTQDAPAEEAGSWADGLKFNIFADAFYQQDWNFPDNPADTAAVAHRDYNYTDGFGLAFAGIDAAYAREHVGATVSLRFGPGAERYLIGEQLRAGANPSTFGGGTPALAALKQAFGSIMPTESLTFDVGLFDTIYGAEVADSWVNLNYTRSPLNYVMQPFYHLGVRATYQVNDHILVRGMVANPTNAYTSFNDIPYVGAQVGYLSEHFSVYAGYMGGEPVRRTEMANNWEHFVDVVATVTAGDLTATFNFDLWHNSLGAAQAATPWGVSGAVGYQISDMFRVAGRVDYLENRNQYFLTGYDELVAATGTLDFRPYDDNVILRLEHRFEKAFGEGGVGNVFADGNGGPRNTWMSTIASVVVRTGN